MTELAKATRDLILAADDLAFEDVEVPEWGCVVRIKAMSGGERDAFESSILKDRSDPSKGVDMRSFRAKFLTRVMIDESGARLFRPDEVKALSAKNARTLDRLYEVGARLAGMRDEDAERLAGNSEGQSEDSTSV